MSAYNYVNHIKVSTFRNLLTGVLRDEWGFDGLVMTDWRNDSHLYQELLAGNDIKMPFGYPATTSKCRSAIRKNWRPP